MPAVSHIVGARPNFMKAAPVIDALASLGIQQRLVHTGQHYSDELSSVFFRDLGMPDPDVNLEAGSGSHAAQTAAIMIALEAELIATRPRLALVYGDVNSTVAGALVASKLGIALGHVEAGLRSFDRTMPEEINRVVTDVLADVLFTTSPEAGDHLAREGIDPGRVHFVGNPMIDTLVRHRDRFDAERMRTRLGIDGRYGVVTLHRPANVDGLERASRLVEVITALAAQIRIVFPVHPRGLDTLTAAGLAASDRIRILEPLGYVDFLSLVSGASLVATDSGGIQEETTILGVPCLTLRPNTERPITITHGTNRLVRPDELLGAAVEVLERPPRPAVMPPLWDGKAGVRIAETVAAFLAPDGSAGAAAARP